MTADISTDYMSQLHKFKGVLETTVHDQNNVYASVSAADDTDAWRQKVVIYYY